MFKNAIVRRPCREMVKGISTAGLGQPDYDKALIQHQHYIDTLKLCGLEVQVLNADEKYPDSTFIEDVALCTPHCAIVTRPGAASRRGETEGMVETLRPYYERIEKIESPGTLDAGDVMMVGSHFYIGISERTNQHGADQLITILKAFWMTGSRVPLFEMLHLKSGLSYLENNTMLVSGEFIGKHEFERFRKIEIDKEEGYAANSLWVNGTVIVPKGFTKTKSKIEAAGYRTIEIDVSEFQKLDGGLSCLSLRF